jgi:hypothetical protein
MLQEYKISIAARAASILWAVYATIFTVDYYAWYALMTNTTLTYHLGGGTTDVSSTYAGPFSATTTMRGPNGNLGSSALSMASILATRLLVMKNTAVTSATGGVGGPVNGIAPRIVAVPMDLEQVAFELCGASLQPTLNNLAAPNATDSANRPNFLQKAGIYPVEIQSAGHADAILHAINERKEGGFATPKQMRCLEKYGWTRAGQLTFTEASKLITRIAANGWRLPQGMVPREMNA